MPTPDLFYFGLDVTIAQHEPYRHSNASVQFDEIQLRVIGCGFLPHQSYGVISQFCLNWTNVLPVRLLPPGLDIAISKYGVCWIWNFNGWISKVWLRILAASDGLLPSGIIYASKEYAWSGSAASSVDSFHLGVSLSVQATTRTGLTTLALGCSRFDFSTSTLDFFHSGSSPSVRNSVSLGPEFSITTSLRIQDKLKVGAEKVYMTGTGSSIDFYVQNTKPMIVENDGGILHGSWTMDSVAVFFDRILKKDVMLLQRTLRAVLASKEIEEVTNVATMPLKSPPNEDGPDGALWLLRQLRPVFYPFRKGAESKFMRFGFIADELESVVPNIVRTTKGKAFTDQKALQYQDLIALLASAAQSQQARIEQQQAQFEGQDQNIATLQQQFDDLQRYLTAKISQQQAPQPEQTQHICYLKEDQSELFEERRLKDIVKMHFEFIGFLSKCTWRSPKKRRSPMTQMYGRYLFAKPNGHIQWNRSEQRGRPQ